MVLAVKCKKTAEDENIFVGGSDENDSESDLLAREKRGGLEQRGQRRSDLGRENVTFENGRIIGIQLFYCKGLKPINCEVADCDLDFERSEIRGAITTPAFRMKNPLSGWIPRSGHGSGQHVRSRRYYHSQPGDFFLSRLEAAVIQRKREFADGAVVQ